MMKDPILTDVVLRFEEVTFGYPGFPSVLDGFSAGLSRGEIVCVIGASGCGKTTLLNLAGGFLLPDKGTILDVEGLVREPRSNRIMVFQDSEQLFPWLTVTDNVTFPLKGTSGAAAKAEKLLSMTGMHDAAGLYPARLSGGMKQRTVLSRALAAGPELLLLDEPFTALDAPTRRGLQDTLLNLNAELGVSMIFVTHDIREAVYIADRLLIMTPGRVREFTVDLERGAGKRDEFSDEFVAIEREVYNTITDI